MRSFSGVICFLSTLIICGCSHTNSIDYANRYDRELGPVIEAREQDWRNGALIYQVIVDRFAPSEDLESKKDLYPSPKVLKSWDEKPRKGRFVEEAKVWSHEIEFWGGDLDSLRGKLDYIEGLGVDVLYLNPIHLAYTNHKYDAQDYFEVSPEYGSREDVADLAEALHQRDMKLMLDGVFNHVGLTSPWFQSAMENPASPWRDWFYIGEEYDMGYRAWVNVPNLPEINLENPEVRDRIYRDSDSVIQGYIREGVDGWRLDVAFDIGFEFLDELTRSAHKAKSDSLVIGEVWNYPDEWSPALDGVMNMTMREVIIKIVRGDVEAGIANQQIERLVNDCGMDQLLKSWIILDNHDIPRLNTVFKEQWRQRMAQVLQFTVPGSPCIYYGVEIGMEGGEDPEQRGPMEWDLVDESNEQYRWMRKLITIRNENPALRVGEFRSLDVGDAIGFMRKTHRAEDAIYILANPSDKPVTVFFPLRDAKIMSYSSFINLLGNEQFTCMAGTLTVTIPPSQTYILKPIIERRTEYSPYKRVQ